MVLSRVKGLAVHAASCLVHAVSLGSIWALFFTRAFLFPAVTHCSAQTRLALTFKPVLGGD